MQEITFCLWVIQEKTILANGLFQQTDGIVSKKDILFKKEKVKLSFHDTMILYRK